MNKRIDEKIDYRYTRIAVRITDNTSVPTALRVTVRAKAGRSTSQGRLENLDNLNTQNNETPIENTIKARCARSSLLYS